MTATAGRIRIPLTSADPDPYLAVDVTDGRIVVEHNGEQILDVEVVASDEPWHARALIAEQRLGNAQILARELLSLSARYTVAESNALRVVGLLHDDATRIGRALAAVLGTDHR